MVVETVGIDIKLVAKMDSGFWSLVDCVEGSYTGTHPS